MSDNVADVDTAQSIWGWLGGDVPTLVSIISSPFFGIGLIVAGLIGIPAADRQSEGKPVRLIWPILGWAIFIISASLMGSVLLFNSFASSSGVLEAERYYKEQHTDRHLKSDQILKIEKAFQPIAGEMDGLQVMSLPASESLQYAREILDAITAGGVRFPKDYLPSIIYSYSTNNAGLSIAVKQPDSPPKMGVLLKDAMGKAGFHLSYIQFNQAGRDFCALVVGAR